MSTKRSRPRPGEGRSAAVPSRPAVASPRLAVLAAALLVVGACAPTTTPQGSAGGSGIVRASEPTATDRGRPVEGDDLGWVKLDGLDLRGAIVASGAASTSATVLLGADTATGALASWTTHDGAHWDRHWLDGSTFGGGIPQVVIAGGPGFIAVGWPVEPILADRSTIWTSVDGIEWRDDPDPSGQFDGGYVAEATLGSTIVVETCCLAEGRPSFHVSEDGLIWAAVNVPAGARDGPMRLAANQIEFVIAHPGGTEADPRAAAWHSRDGRAWTEDATFDAALEGLQGTNDLFRSGAGLTVADDGGGYREIASDGSAAAVAPPAVFGQLSGGGVGLLWLGVPDGAACDQAWVWTSGRWHAIGADADVCVRPFAMGFRSPLTAMVDGGLSLPDGWLIVGAGAAAATMEAWSLRPHGLVAAVDPPTGAPPEPPSASIPRLPLDALVPSGSCPTGRIAIDAILALDGPDQLGCFGGRSLTFRAWVVDTGDPQGGACVVALIPGWIQPCARTDWLGATDVEHDPHLVAVHSPDATGDLEGLGRWVSVTGHFDDPAAATCRAAEGPVAPGLPPIGALVMRCRQTFVITSLATVH